MKIFFAFFLLAIGNCYTVFSQPLGDYSIRVEVSGNGFNNLTQVYFDDDPVINATYGYDACCEASFILGNSGQPHLFTEVVAAPYPPGVNRMSINAFPHLFEPLDIPLGFLPGQLAAYELVFKELYRFPVGTQITLEDIPQQVIQDLVIDSVYDTWGAPADDPERFIIHIIPSTVTGIDGLGVDQSKSSGWFECGSGLIKNLTPSTTYSISIYSILGELLFLESFNGKAEIQLPIQNLSSGYYICKVKGDGERLFRFVK